MTTLRREAIQTAESILIPAYSDNPPTEDSINYAKEQAAKVVDALLELRGFSFLNESIDPQKNTKPLSSPKRGDVIDAMLAYQNGEYWKGRETFLAEDLPLADFWHTATGQPLNGNKAQLKSLRKAVTAWRDQRLSVASLQAALDNRKAWKKGGLVSDPNEITADAAAIEAAGGLRTDESRGEYRPSRISA